MRSRLITSALLATTLIAAAFSAIPVHAATPVDKFVRTAAPFLKGVTPADYDALARFDLVALLPELQLQGSTVFDELRKRNPNIIIIAYVPTKSVAAAWQDALHTGLRAGIDDGWWLRDANGGIISVWPGTQALNPTTGWGTYLPRYVHDHILATGLWDGIFWDEVSGDISWVNAGNVDMNRDFSRDAAAEADNAWKSGMVTMLRTARELDPEKYSVINGASTPELQQFVNGRMFESFPTPWEAGGDWNEIMRRYTVTERQVHGPATFIVNANTGNSGNLTDYRKVRFSLGSTLLGNGFFSFDFGDKDHGQSWWYDEYGAYLGTPSGAPKNMDRPDDATWRAGVWRRDYQNGVVIVNATTAPRTLVFDSEYEKLHGAQDPSVNDGSITSSVTIGPRDGVLMLRPLDKLENAAYVNGSFARIFNGAGTPTRTGFFAYDQRFRGSTIVLETDFDKDGQLETLVAERDRVRVYNQDLTERVNFAPFGPQWRNGMEVGTGDVDGDGVNDLVVAAGPGGAPMVKVFDLAGHEKKNFLAYAKNFRGGVHLAVGNVDADAAAEIVTGAGPKGGPHVRIFTGNGIVKNQFFAYDQRFRGGVYVAAGDVLGLGHGQVVTGAGFGGGPEVRIFDVTKRNAQVGGWFAFDQKLHTGVRVGAADTDGNGVAELFGMSTDVFTVTSDGTPAPEIPVAEIPESEIRNPQFEPPAENPIDTTIPERPLFLGARLNTMP